MGDFLIWGLLARGKDFLIWELFSRVKLNQMYFLHYTLELSSDSPARNLYQI